MKELCIDGKIPKSRMKQFYGSFVIPGGKLEVSVFLIQEQSNGGSLSNKHDISIKKACPIAFKGKIS